MSLGEITYQYCPREWCLDRFLECGGYTVVFMNYNKRDYIGDSVASALNQDYPILEMFFMDDASADGSGDVMENMVRAYRGRHKVTVVRNTENQGIVGQWNIVRKLALGNWLGMFCADDIARFDRVSMTANEICKIPGLIGITTSGKEVNHLTGENGRHIGEGVCRYTVSDNDSGDDLANRWLVMIGATAFWHRSLFDKDLPGGPMDDTIIFFRLLSRRFDIKGISYLYAADLETIDYSIGFGVSTSFRVDTSALSRAGDIWAANIMSRKNSTKVDLLTARAIMSGEDYRNADERTKGFELERYYRIMCWRCNTIGRLLFLPGMMIELARGRLGPEMKKRIVLLYAKRLVSEFFGVSFTKFIINCFRG